MQIDAQTHVTGVIGYPVRHSRSPEMQSVAMQALGLNWIYVALEVRPEMLKQAIDGARAMGFVGLNVTIPHKTTVIDFIDELSPDATAIGAVNTIHFVEGRALGENTDAVGYTRTVEEDAAFCFTGKTVLQIGAGGAGRAMAAGAAKAGAETVFIVNRDETRARSLVTDLSKAYPETSFEWLTPDQTGRYAPKADLIANATSLGMRPDDPLPIDEELIEPHHIVFDTVYNSEHTPLMAAALRQKAKPVHGLGMLVRQGARSLEIWSGTYPDEALMIQTLKNRMFLHD